MALLAGAPLALAASASAGTYDVLSCAAAPGQVNNAWTRTNTHPAIIETGAVSPCPAGGEFSGLWANDDLDFAGDAPHGAKAEYVFDAAAGTTITAWTYNRWLGKQITNSWSIYTKYAGTPDAILDSCQVPGDGDPCARGAPGFQSAGERTAAGFSTSKLAFGFTCVNPGAMCSTGSTIHRVWAALYSSRVTLTDPSPPTLGAATGPLARDGTVSGTQSITFGASDNSGIGELRVLVGGQIRAAAAGACDYTQRLPCGDQPGATLQVDTTQIQDGSYPVEIAAVDATAGRPSENLARQQVATVTIDNVPPASAGAAPAAGTTTGGYVYPPGTDGPARSLPTLTLGRLRISGRRASVPGRLAPTASKFLSAELSARLRGRKVRHRVKVAPDVSGRFVIGVPAIFSRARTFTAVVSFPGDAGHLAGRVERRFRSRPKP